MCIALFTRNHHSPSVLLVLTQTFNHSIHTFIYFAHLHTHTPSLHSLSFPVTPFHTLYFTCVISHLPPHHALTAGQYNGDRKPMPEYHVKIAGFDEKVHVNVLRMYMCSSLDNCISCSHPSVCLISFCVIVCT